MSGGRRGGGARQGRGRRGVEPSPVQRFPRTARVNKLLLEVLAESLERLVVADDRLSLLTITAVDCDPEFATATVLFSSLDDDERLALADARVRLQAEIGRQVRLKRTPLLRFAADPAIESGRRIEDILRTLDRSAGDGASPGDDGSPADRDSPVHHDPAARPGAGEEGLLG